MKPDFDQLRKDTYQLTEAEGRNEVIADLNKLEESEAKFELLQNEISERESKQRRNSIYAALLAAVVAVISGWYILSKISQGQLTFKRNVILLDSEPFMFWFQLAFPILVFFLMIVWLVFMVFSNPTFKRDSPRSGRAP